MTSPNQAASEASMAMPALARGLASRVAATEAASAACSKRKESPRVAKTSSKSAAAPSSAIWLACSCAQ